MKTHRLVINVNSRGAVLHVIKGEGGKWRVTDMTNVHKPRRWESSFDSLDAALSEVGFYVDVMTRTLETVEIPEEMLS